ncbi:MAG: COX15/CtaA family protein [Pyrinomonadaceae bacterium]|nr:COX15/CtaA family protein [Pyrinomonadaceae bacterium]
MNQLLLCYSVATSERKSEVVESAYGASVRETIPTSIKLDRKTGRFSVYAWVVLGFNLLVILWGAYVRASGSGAGCGSHWPLCNGEVVPRTRGAETLIELTHRTTSGVALLLVLGLLVWAFRAFPRKHPARLGAVLSVFFIITEALIGAGLVLFGFVADNDSIGRAVYLSIHLVNTFLLLAALALTAWWASGGSALKLRGHGALSLILCAGLVGALVLGVSGAVTALGDTLFPGSTLMGGLRDDFSPTAHILVRLRVLHPTIALLVSSLLIFAARFAADKRPVRTTKRLAWALAILVLIELCAGLVNLILLAPIPMQIVHLLLADLVWTCLVLLTASALGEETALSHVSNRA